MNTNLSKLQPYPFEKLNKLISQHKVDTQLQAVSLAIGEPKHPTPAIIKDELIKNINELCKYPTTRGANALRNACASWIRNRFQISEKISIVKKIFCP